MKKLLIGLLLVAGNVQAGMNMYSPFTHHHHHPKLNIANTALALSRQTIGYTTGLRIGLKASGHTEKQINNILKSPAYLASYEASMIEKLQEKRYRNADINKIIAIWSVSNTPKSYRKLLVRNGYHPQKAHSIVKKMIGEATQAAHNTIKKMKMKKQYGKKFTKNRSTKNLSHRARSH